ncbi:MAG: endospore germination permease [Oscillospiraceae bacterium]|nr:endospore germination permease [Oscillospiraceae bacterium]
MVSKLSFRGAVAILVVFYLGSGAVFAVPRGLGTDGWIVQLIGFVMTVPLLLLFARLVRLMPGKDLFEMLSFAFGRILSVVISGLYFLYFILLAATMRVSYAEFVRLVSLTNTPLIVLLLAFFLVTAYLAKSGVLTMGKWSALLMALLLFVTVGVTLLAIPNMRLENLLPVASSGGSAILRGGGQFALSSFGGAVVFLALVGQLAGKASPYKVFLVGGAVACGFFVLLFLRDAAILGGVGMDNLLFPAYKAVSVIRVGSTGGSIAFLTALPFLAAGLTLVAVYLIAAARSLRWIFSLRDEHAIVVPQAFFSVGLAAILFPNLAALFSFPALHVYFAPLFQFVIPGFLWVVAEVKCWKNPVVSRESETPGR